MNEEIFTPETKIDILKFIYLDQRKEMEYRREREYRIFIWSSNILLALIGALLITKQPDAVAWGSFGVNGSIVATTTVFLIVMFSIQWQNRNNRFRGQNAQVISRIEKLLHGFEKGFFDPGGSMLLLEEWSEEEKSNKKKSWFQKTLNYRFATIILGILAIAMLWIPYLGVV